MIVHDILNEATLCFAEAGIPSPRLDAEVLLAFCLDCDRLEFFKNPLRPVDEKVLALFQKLVTRRLKEEPVAYITSRKEFWSFVLEVNKSVLIPRPDTEVLVEEALGICKGITIPEIKILDIGTGSGAIALALACELPRIRVTATDISAAALAVAEKNARNLRLDSQIKFLQGNLFQPVGDFFDIIVSNPPYIADEEYDKLPGGVKNYEPREALQAGLGGLDFYRKIVNEAPAHLKHDGWLLLETGAAQSVKVISIAEASGQFDDMSVRNDYAGLPRVIKARRK
ncbi:MAG: Release factor glutamine methyltransferase [Smithella sp. PtaU1.Bin162]|nr:MAG: Release factor glutamine methyltransferase [Smithella sp. PtaU1.Bin162]